MLKHSDISDHNVRVTRNLDIALLRAFVAVADHRSVTAASQSLHLTQGAVSQQIARLEAISGRPLLKRGRRGMSLTSAGEHLLENARRLLALNDEVWTDISGGTVGGVVRLGAPYDLVGTPLTPVLKAFCTACPQVELSLVCRSSPELARDLASGQIDLAVLEEPVESATGECLAVDRLLWAGARGGTAYARTPLPLTLVAETCVFKSAVLVALRGQGREWKTAFESGSLDATLATVRADLAISVWLATTIPADLTILPPKAGLPELPSYAITLHVPNRPSTPAARELARFIRDRFARPVRPDEMQRN